MILGKNGRNRKVAHFPRNIAEKLQLRLGLTWILGTGESGVA